MDGGNEGLVSVSVQGDPGRGRGVTSGQRVECRGGTKCGLGDEERVHFLVYPRVKRRARAVVVGGGKGWKVVGQQVGGGGSREREGGEGLVVYPRVRWRARGVGGDCIVQ